MRFRKIIVFDCVFYVLITITVLVLKALILCSGLPPISKKVKENLKLLIAYCPFHLPSMVLKSCYSTQSDRNFTSLTQK